MKSIYINGHYFYEGDHVTAILETDFEYINDTTNDDFVSQDNDEETITVNGILHIETDDQCYICQNVKSGDNSHASKYNKKYSWYVRISENGDIISNDTVSISFKSKVKPVVLIGEDDDPMPDDWQLPFAIPENL